MGRLGWVWSTFGLLQWDHVVPHKSVDATEKVKIPHFYRRYPLNMCPKLRVLIMIYGWMQGRLGSHMLLRTATMECRNRRGEQLARRIMTLHSTLPPPTVIPRTRNLFTIPYLIWACSQRRDVCMIGKTPIFTLCYLMNGRQHQHGRAKLDKTSRLSCL
jgi:hypothetical protein